MPSLFIRLCPHSDALFRAKRRPRCRCERAIRSGSHRNEWNYPFAATRSVLGRGGRTWNSPILSCCFFSDPLCLARAVFIFAFHADCALLDCISCISVYQCSRRRNCSFFEVLRGDTPSSQPARAHSSSLSERVSDTHTLPPALPYVARIWVTSRSPISMPHIPLHTSRVTRCRLLALAFRGASPICVGDFVRSDSVCPFGLFDCSDSVARRACLGVVVSLLDF